MPRFISEESRQRWIDSRRRTFAARRAAKSQQTSEILADVPREQVMLPPAVISPLNGLDDKIAQLQAELAILEQAREILAR